MIERIHWRHTEWYFVLAMWTGWSHDITFKINSDVIWGIQLFQGKSRLAVSETSQWTWWNEVGQRQAELIINTLLKTANGSWVDVPKTLKKAWTLTGRSKLTKLVQNDYIIDLPTYPFEKFGCFMFIYDNNLICNIFCFPLLKKPSFCSLGPPGGCQGFTRPPVLCEAKVKILTQRILSGETGAPSGRMAVMAGRAGIRWFCWGCFFFEPVGINSSHLY